MTILISLLRQFYPYILAASVGFGAAWSVQGFRLTAEKQRFTEYKLNQSEQENKDLAEAKAKSKRLSNQLTEAQHAATKREQLIRSLSSSLSDANKRLRDTTNQIAESLSGYSAEASRIAAATYAKLFTACQGEYATMAETADRHASDVKTLIDAWPTVGD